MIAAKLRHKDLVSDVLRCSKLVNTNSDYLQTFIHSRNKSGQTLLHMVALQGPELEEQKLLILRKEIEIHCIRWGLFSVEKWCTQHITELQEIEMVGCDLEINNLLVNFFFLHVYGVSHNPYCYPMMTKDFLGQEFKHFPDPKRCPC